MKPFQYRSRLSSPSPKRLKETLLGIEYYMNIINEICVGYSIDIESTVKKSPLYRMRSKQKVNGYFRAIHKYDMVLLADIIGGYASLAAEIHDMMDEYIGADLKKFEFTIYMVLTKNGSKNPEAMSRMYVAMTLANFCKCMYNQYASYLNQISSKLLYYYRMFDFNGCFGKAREAYISMCDEGKEYHSKDIYEDNNVMIGFKVIENKLSDTDKILEIIEEAQDRTGTKDNEDGK